MVAVPPLMPAVQVRHWAPGLASATRPLAADSPCGDTAAWFAFEASSANQSESTPQPAHQGLLAIVDGLGHGSEAALAADQALQVLAADPEAPLPALMQRLDAALTGLRGAAVGLVQRRGSELLHAAVGNTRLLRLRGAEHTRLPSQNGVVGGGLPARVSVSSLQVQPGDWLLLFTDGIAETLALPVMLPEWSRDAGLLCSHVLAQAPAGRDDAGVLAMQVLPAAAPEAC